MKYILTLAFLALFSFSAMAADSAISGLTECSTAISSDEFVAARSGANCKQTTTGLTSYVQSNTSADDISDISTTGVATGDLLYYSVSGFEPLNIDEIVTYGVNSVALGVADGSGNSTTLIGANFTNKGGTSSTGVGANVDLGTVNETTAVGANSSATVARASAFGRSATASGANSTALGKSAAASGAFSTALGSQSTCAFGDSTSVGYNATCSADNQIMMGTVEEDVYIAGTLTHAGFTSAGNLVYSSAGGRLLSASPNTLVSDFTCLRASNEGEDAATGTDVNRVYFPYAITVSSVYAYAGVAPVGSTASFGLNEAGTSVLSTDITIDASEFTSGTAATPPVISDASIAANAKISVDIDQVGSGTTGQGYVVCFDYSRQ